MQGKQKQYKQNILSTIIHRDEKYKQNEIEIADVQKGTGNRYSAYIKQCF